MTPVQNGKDVIYVDIDEEITAIIEKVEASRQKIVALVLPKRATVFQSVVNMKLLKRAADNQKKNLVLITSEASLLPLAGAVGLHVAKTPQSKPEIPENPTAADDEEAIDEDEALMLEDEKPAAYTAENAGDRPVGELAGDAATAAPASKAPGAIETLNLEDTTPAADKDKPTKTASKKTPRVPNFSAFRNRIFLGVLGLVVILAGLYVCAFVLPKATIAIGTDATDYNSSFDFTLDTTASKPNINDRVLPAMVVQQQKTYTANTPATGQQDNGTRASGEVTLTNCSKDGKSIKIPAGTAVSVNGLNYITQSDASMPTSSSGSCKSYPGFTADTVGVTAQQNGDKYNIGDGTKLAVAGHSDVAAVADGAIDGGTSKIVTVVSQKDIDDAKAKIDSANTSEIKKALAQQLNQNNLYPIQASFVGDTPNITTDNKVGDEAASVTVTQSVTYNMFGVKRDYLDQLIQNDIEQQIDTKTQVILNDGLDRAKYNLTENTDTTSRLSLATVATVGPHIDTDALKDQVKGKKSGYIKSLIGNQPGVTDVRVKLSPFWVSSVPNKGSHITITVDKAATTQHDTNSR